jgi:uncharacterized phiE125 gp8 family phage protein
MGLSLVSAPTADPLDLIDAKRHLRIEDDVTDDDDLVGSLISAAGERAELATHRALIRQTWDLVLDSFPDADFIEIPKPPLVSITSVSYIDTGGVTQTFSSSGYVVTAPAGPRCARGRLALKFGSVWPVTQAQRGAVTIRFIAGYGGSWADVPSLLRAGMKLDVGTLYENRESALIGLRGTVEELPFGVRAIYFSYRSHATQRLGA